MAVYRLRLLLAPLNSKAAGRMSSRPLLSAAVVGGCGIESSLIRLPPLRYRAASSAAPGICIPPRTTAWCTGTTAQRTLVTGTAPCYDGTAEEATLSSSLPKKRRRSAPSSRLKMRKPPVTLTAPARIFFRQLLMSTTIRDDVIGILLDYHQSTSGQPRMVYSFRFVTATDIDESLDESVPLWEEEEKHDDNDEAHNNEDGPKTISTSASSSSSHPKLYVHHNAFLKVLGATLDVDVATVTPILYDREGNLMDPNA
jgi:hypothetical protein